MSKGKDFYGKDIAEVIEQACAAFAVREDLDIEVLETGSAGIFGLCKKGPYQGTASGCFFDCRS